MKKTKYQVLKEWRDDDPYAIRGKNNSDILLNKKSLERIVETKFHDLDIKVTKLTTTVNEYKQEVDGVPTPSSSDDDDSPLQTHTQFRTRARSSVMPV
ncbi:hypothetical protein D1007_28387 [Hordeum vulgare]|nr:hypothetical protein D1007_28387 [Hordeum vulgare]